MKTLNEVFRLVHTLKGLSGLFGAAQIAGLSHELENVLDDLRLGRIDLTPLVLDCLFQALDLYSKILKAERDNTTAGQTEIEGTLLSLARISQQNAAAGTTLVAPYEIEPGLLGVLSEYEEHRLRANIQEGQRLYRIFVKFTLTSFETSLDEFRELAKQAGEIISYLPTGADTDPNTIELQILFGSPHAIESLGPLFPTARVEEVKRRKTSPSRPAGSLAPRRDTPAGMAAVRGPIMTMPPPSELAPHDTTRAILQDPTVRSVSQTVRVDIRKLDHLMMLVGELAIVKTAMSRLAERMRAQSELRRPTGELLRLHKSFERHLLLLQDAILEVRMVPLGQVFDKLARVVRQFSRELSKDVNLVITGAETEIDKLIVEELSDPLMHMIRNALDHGIEAKEERVRVGKPVVGTIALNAFQKGNHVVIEVEDDGQGIDADALMASALRLGLVNADEVRSMTRREVLGLIFQPGFTTKRAATDLSGRGVGLDVVKNNIARLGGVVDVTSETGTGTKLTITLPITLAIINVLLVEVGGQLFGLPLANVDEVLGFVDGALRIVDGAETISLRGASLRVCRMHQLLEIHPAETLRSSLVVITVGQRRVGFVVERMLGQESVVIKSLGESLRRVRGIAGAAELGDQRVVLILDATGLVEEVFATEKETIRLRARSLPT